MFLFFTGASGVKNGSTILIGYDPACALGDPGASGVENGSTILVGDDPGYALGDLGASGAEKVAPFW